MLKFIKSNLFFFLLLTIVVFSLYGKSTFFNFTYHDDNILILEKIDFLSDIKNVTKIFTTSAFFFKDNPYYRPILNISFMADTIISKNYFVCYHLTNIILFLFTIYLMYIFLSKLYINKIILKFICLLVAVHPVFVSTVVWIPSRNDTILAIFVYLSFIFFIDYLKYKKIKSLILYSVFWMLSLYTKETALFIPLLYGLLVLCFNYKLNGKDIVKNILILMFLTVTYFCFRKNFVSTVGIEDYFCNFLIYFNNFINGTTIYLKNFLIPDNIPLILFNIKLSFKYFLFDCLLILFLIFVLYKKIADKKIILFGFTCFLVIIFPAFLLKEYAYLNHRLILPIFGIVIIMTVCFDFFIKKYKTIIKPLIILYVCFFAVFYFVSFKYQDYYKNRYIYWSRAYLDAPTYQLTCYWVHRLYLENNNLEKAREFLQKAMEYVDDKNKYLSDLAFIYYREKNMDKAEELYNKSIECGINKAQCYRNLSVIYLKRDKNIKKAIEYAELAVQHDPYDVYYKDYLEKLTDEKNNI